MSSPVISIKLALADPNPADGFEIHTELLRSSYEFRTDVILGFCAPDLRKDESVSGIFNEVEPLNGSWKLELAVELPDLLPTIEDKSEAIFDFTSKSGNTSQLCISNRMSRFYFLDDDEAKFALMPRTQQRHGSAHVIKGENKIVAAEYQARSMISMTFPIHGSTTEQAFESSIDNCLNTLFLSVNNYLQALRESYRHLAPITRLVSKDSIDFVYVLVSGATPSKAARLGLNFNRFMRLPGNLDSNTTSSLRRHFRECDQIDDVSRYLGEAESSCASGDYEYALLQAVICAEIATKRAIYHECIKNGVSSNKFKDSQKDMTYSWALNIGLPLIYDSRIRPDSQLIDTLNGARKKRNSLMHEASTEVDRTYIRRLLDDTRSYLEQLKKTSALSTGDLQIDGAGI